MIANYFLTLKRRGSKNEADEKWFMISFENHPDMLVAVGSYVELPNSGELETEFKVKSMTWHPAENLMVVFLETLVLSPKVFNSLDWEEEFPEDKGFERGA